MPQMMPINWMISFFFFILIFMLFNNMNYFITLNNPQNKKEININFNKNHLIWKW
uniref:ATP synthase complex subunit 8 n=1 Tax=Adhemarius sexoculata TaxID=1086120 RepID=A0A6G6D7Q2_9NEOP|nr:ATP synthase F0 subunit 8 [Adhemarius sexoculata]